MSGFADYEGYDGLGLAALVGRGETTPDELLEAAIERVETKRVRHDKLYIQALLTAAPIKTEPHEG